MSILSIYSSQSRHINLRFDSGGEMNFKPQREDTDPGSGAAKI